jgi:ATP-dependent DNA helicase RecG
VPTGLVERREQLAAEVAALLAAIDRGEGAGLREVEGIDFKEEAGRRGRGGELEPGEKTNEAAAEKLADEVCCMANTPGGGALILGVEDKSHAVLGTELDQEWLRHRIYRLVDIAPAIEERQAAGQRVLVLFVAESPEPTQDTKGRIRWRVGDNCEPVDRSEWWIKRESEGDLDPMARVAPSKVDDVTPGALERVRRSFVDDSQSTVPTDIPPRDLLQLAGAVRPNDALTEAGRLLLCAAGRPLITFTALTVHGGDVTAFYEPDPEHSLLEQLADVEGRIDARNDVTVVSNGFTEQRLQSVPGRAVREAVLNGLIHRDWNTHAPTEVTWIEHDATLIVKSPGGFTGGINVDNILTNRHSRYPALADLFRALRLVDKQGVGIDRMYTSMITLGHRPPHIVETAGPAVVCTLVGGKPVVPVIQLVAAIRPEARQADVRIAVLLHALMYQAFVSLDDAARLLQTDKLSAGVALRAASSSTVDGESLIRMHKDVWVLGRSALRLAKRARTDIHEPDFLAYCTTERHVIYTVVEAWLEDHESITTGDLVQLTSMSRPTAAQVLGELEGTVVRSAGAGRTARFERLR